MTSNDSNAFDAFASLALDSGPSNTDSNASVPEEAEKSINGMPALKETTFQKFQEGQSVTYRSQGNITTAKILRVHLDDQLEPYYDIQLPNGNEKQTDNSHLTPYIEKEAANVSSSLDVAMTSNTIDGPIADVNKTTSVSATSAQGQDNIQNHQEQQMQMGSLGNASEEKMPQTSTGVSPELLQMIQGLNPTNTELVKNFMLTLLMQQNQSASYGGNQPAFYGSNNQQVPSNHPTSYGSNNQLVPSSQQQFHQQQNQLTSQQVGQGNNGVPQTQHHQMNTMLSNGLNHQQTSNLSAAVPNPPPPVEKEGNPFDKF